MTPLACARGLGQGIMGLKRHSAKGRGQRVKNSCTMRYALCALPIFIPSTRQGLKSQKIPLFSISCKISETLDTENYHVIPVYPVKK